MLISQNAEVVHGQRKVGNPCFRACNRSCVNTTVNDAIQNHGIVLDREI